MSSRLARLVAPLSALAVVLAGCSSVDPSTSASTSVTGTATTATTPTSATTTSTPGATGSTAGEGTSTSAPSEATALPYARTGAGMLTGNMVRAKQLVYVPGQMSGWVDVVDPHTYRVIRSFRVATSPEHVVPNHDGSVLWVNSDTGNTLTPINPVTGVQGTPLSIPDPYNLYFSPEGRYALVMAERLHRIDVRDAHTMKLVHSTPVPCYGLNHADFTADLTAMVASCEFDGHLLVLDADGQHVRKVINLNAVKTPGATPPSMAASMGGPKASLRPGASSMPQDVRLTPDGQHFLAADMLRNGVWVISARTFAIERFIPTALGAHGIYPSRDASRIYVSNRDAGSVSVLDAATLAVVATWTIPGGGSPDMGGVSADGRQLWLSGRYNAQVYVFDTPTGKLVHRISTHAGPHGLLVWPQPGVFSLGHTGNMR